MSHGSPQSLKAATAARVNTGVSTNQAIARLNGQYDSLCIASAVDLQNDVFGRNVGSLGVDMRGAPECNSYMPPGQSTMDHIRRENLERPYSTIGPLGLRGAADLMGVGRDVIPQDLYGMGLRGNFVRWGSPGLRLAEPDILLQSH